MENPVIDESKTTFGATRQTNAYVLRERYISSKVIRLGGTACERPMEGIRAFLFLKGFLKKKEQSYNETTITITITIISKLP